MASAYPESYNPFEAPTTNLSPTLPGPAGDDVEAIRRRHLAHEAWVKFIGILHYLGAVAFGVGGVAMIGYAVVTGSSSQPRPANPSLKLLLLVGVMLAVCVGACYGAIGYGLWRLRSWARWVMVVLCGLSLFANLADTTTTLLSNPSQAAAAAVGNCVAAAITGLLLYLMLSAKGAVVFSPGYREVVRQTPHIRYRASLLVKIVLGLILAPVGVGLAAIFSGAD